MEAVPRLPMLSFDMKIGVDSVDFSTKLKQYIRDHYNEDPEMYSNEIHQLEGLRSAALHPTKDVAGCADLKRYYCQLHFLASRFPMYKDGEAAVEFSWKDIYHNVFCTLADIMLEMMSILYNIGALHSQLGAADNRTTADGMKMSCTHFQCAAWTFQQIHDEYPQGLGMDVSPDIMLFLYQLCLAQAQECILEKSMMDNRKASIISKVAVQTVDYYKQALKMLVECPADDNSFAETISSKLYKKWEKYLKFKVSYHRCITLLYQGQQSAEQQKMGERVAYYQAAFEKLEEARKLSKGLDNIEAVNEALTFVHDVVEGKRKAAKNENEFIYHEEVPNIALLSDVKGASLVKGIPFNTNDIEVSGPDIFARIVPMKAHESSSMYSEEKAKLFRKVASMVDNKDEELESFLATLQLDVLKMEANTIPQELIDRCAALSAKPDAIQNLVESMNELTEIYHDVEGMLKEIKELLRLEERNEKEYQEMVGNRPPSIAATDLTREANKYQEAHARASESNQTLHKAKVLHIANLKLLSLPLREIERQIPSVVINTPEGEAITKEMQRLMGKVDEMKDQRAKLLTQLRNSICEDDITRQVVTYNGENLQNLFQQELQKHQRYVSLIEQNLSAQENILKAVKDSYARYASTRKSTTELVRRRETIIASLIASYDAYEDLMAKSKKGLEFYKKLETNVSKLLQRVKGTVKVQDEEREQMIKSVRNSESVHEPASSGGMKLKDYLNIKKETGKLSLEYPTPVSANPYYPAEVASQNWMPGIRPAPVGSEETDTTKVKVDSFGGFYQSQTRDNTWTGSFYPEVVNPNDKGKYYPQGNANVYPTNATYPSGSNQTSPYPTATEVYTAPRSNYYTTQTQQPAQNYPEYVVPANQSSQFVANNMYISQPSTVPAVEPEVTYTPQPGNYLTSQPQVYATGYQGVVPESSSTVSYPSYTGQQPSSYSYSSPQHGYSSTAATGYPQTSSYGNENPSTGSYAPVATSYDPRASGYSYVPQPGYMPYGSVQPEQPVQPVPDYYNNPTYPNATYPTSEYSEPSTEYIPSQYGNAAASSQQPNGVMPWNQPAPITTEYVSQYYQKENTSLYTASNSGSNYAMTDSEVYKTTENYPAATVPEQDQYYTNQYGGYPNQSVQSPSTYMQAGNDRQQAHTTITYSNNDSVSSPSMDTSNVDLLAGLDFNIDQSPLVPETTNVVRNEEPEPKPIPAVPVEKKQETVDLNIANVTTVQEKSPSKDSLMENETLNQFAQDVEKYEKFVEGLTLKTLNGPTCLDLKWKEVIDLQEKTAPLHIISVARCYPMKNRFPDILPYDDSRVELPSTKDDYINASRMKDLTKLTPPFILTQAPLPSTYSDFWAMVYEQQVEVIVCLVNDSEIDGHCYWPTEKGQELEMGRLKVTLQSSNVRPHWVERILSLCLVETRVTRVVVHLQFTAWPGSSFPPSPGPFLSFTTEAMNFLSQQRSSNHAVVVHCMSGVGRTGLFCLIVAAILEIQAGKGVPDLVIISARMSQFRKNCLRDREHLKFAYQAVLYYSQDLLMKRGILTSRSGFEDKKLKDGKCHTRHPSEDFLLGPPTDLNQLQSGIEKLGFDSAGKKNETDKLNVEVRSQSACSRRSSFTNSGTSSGRSSPASSVTTDVLAALDPTNFSLKLDQNKPAKSTKKRFTPDSFMKKSQSGLDAFNSVSDDPLSRLDPLWTMKK